MGDDIKANHRRAQPSSTRTPPSGPGMYSKRHHSPRMSSSESADMREGGRGEYMDSPSPNRRHHHHHLRERGAPRSRGEEEEAFGRERGGRRNRPRSVSMPEGMELQARVRDFFRLLWRRWRAGERRAVNAGQTLVRAWVHWELG